MRVVRKAVIPVAGMGTRFLPATKAVPKEMLPIVDRPAVQYIVEEAAAAGLEEIVFVTARGKDSILDHFDVDPDLERFLQVRGRDEQVAQMEELSSLVKVVSIRQGEPLGLGHAVLCARPFVGDEPFAVLLGDDILCDRRGPAISQLIKVFEQTGGGVVSIMEVPPDQTNLYGIMGGTQWAPGVYRASEIVEKPHPSVAPSRMAVLGRYVLPPGIFDLLEVTKPGAGGEIQLTDGLARLIGGPHDGGGGLFGVVFEGERYDIGDKFGYLEANVAFALKRPDLRHKTLEMLRKYGEQLG